MIGGACNSDTGESDALGLTMFHAAFLDYLRRSRSVRWPTVMVDPSKVFLTL